MSLNPFAAGLKVLDQLEALESAQQTQWLNKEADRLSQEENQELLLKKQTMTADSRDILGEMVLAALVMITGGEPKEEDRIRRSDRMLIMEAIILAARNGREAGRTQMIASDIVAAFAAVSANNVIPHAIAGRKFHA